MANQWKKRATVAYGYSLTRLALNAYMFFDTLSAGSEEHETWRKDTEAACWDLLDRHLEGSLEKEVAEQLRQQIRSAVEDIIAYTDGFQIYEYALNRVERRFVEAPSRLEWSEEECISQVMGFITSAREASAMNRRIQEVLEQLPIRYTRQKFYGIVMESMTAFIGSDRENLDNFLYVLRTCGMAELTKNRRERWPELAALFEELERLEFKELTAESYQEARQKLQLASEQLLAMSDYYQLFQELVNDLLVLCLTSEEAIHDASGEIHALNILRRLAGLYQEGTRGIPEELEQELESLEGVQETWYENYQRLAPAPDYHEGENGEAGKERCVDRLLSSSLFAPLEETPEASHVLTRQEVETAAQGLVAALDPVLTACKKPVMRAVMASILGHLPVSFHSLDEVLAYIRRSMDSCTDRAEKETCMELLQQLMESEDYALL